MGKLKKPELFIHDSGKSTLGRLQREEDESDKGSLHIVIFVLLAGLLILGINDNLSQKKEDIVLPLENVTSTSTTTSTTSTSTSTSTTTFTSSSSTLTTTIEECGGDWEPPCENESGTVCDAGNIIGSEGICHTPERGKSVPSGQEGCGSWAVTPCSRCD